MQEHKRYTKIKKSEFHNLKILKYKKQIKKQKNPKYTNLKIKTYISINM